MVPRWCYREGRGSRREMRRGESVGFRKVGTRRAGRDKGVDR